MKIGPTSFAAPCCGSVAPIRSRAWKRCEKPIHAEPTLRTLPRSGAQLSASAERVTVADVIRTAGARAELREALIAVAGERGAINNRRLGKWLAEIAGRIVDDSRFEQCGQRQGVALWQLETA